MNPETMPPTPTAMSNNLNLSVFMAVSFQDLTSHKISDRVWECVSLQIGRINEMKVTHRSRARFAASLG